MATQQVQKLSFKKSAFVEGGMIAEGRYLIENGTVVEWDYDGKSQNKTIAYRAEFHPITVDNKGKITKSGEMKLFYASAGDPAKIGASPDGTGFVAVTSTGLSKSSNFYIWIEHIEGAGFPEDEFDNDVTVWNNMGVEVVNIPAPKRENLQQSNLVQAGPPQPQREKTITVVKVIGKMPSEKAWNMSGVPASAAAAKPIAAPPAKTNATPAAKANKGGDDNAEKLQCYLAPILEGNESSDRTQTRVAAFKAMGKDSLDKDEKKTLMDLFNDDAELETILNGIGGGYTIDGANIVSMG